MTSLTEIGIVLVVIVMISGVFLTSYENVTDKMIKTGENHNIEALMSETLDNLINSPGMPDNWFELEKGTPGLAVVNEGDEVIPNSVSYQKFMALGNSYGKMVDEKLFTSNMHSSMELIPQKSSVSSVKIGSGHEDGNIHSLMRLVKCDFYRKYVLKDFQNPGKCNHNHDQAENSCNYFKIFKGNVKRSDYYLLVDDSEKYDIRYIVDTTRVVKERYWENANSGRISLNDKINFYDDTSAVVFIHFDRPHAKAVLVSVPKDFDRTKLSYDYFRTNECQLVLKVWY